MFAATLIPFTVVLLSSTTLGAPAAAPSTLAARSTDYSTYCPAGWRYYDRGVCSSGFEGCAPSTDSAICVGEKRYWGTCGGYGNNFVCATNGFRGCNTNPGVCDSKPAAPALAIRADLSTYCPAGWRYYDRNVCSSGFEGCAPPTDSSICVGDKRFWGTCGGYGNNFVCATNGFHGCNTNSGVCNSKPAPQSPTAVPVQPTDEQKKPAMTTQSWSCAEGEIFYPAGWCSSGFAGCTKDYANCDGGKKFGPGECPAGMTFQNCENGKGFKGCSANNRMCG